MIKKTLGGDRLGSGNKVKVAMHNYERSTHDLGNVWRSTVAPGVLTPFYKKLALNGDTWDIDLSTLVRTAPANGPLFGSYKLQCDVFTVPIRLYNGILHNNMTKIGMDMSKVKLPKLLVKTETPNRYTTAVSNFETSQISPSSLMAYMGVRGLGDFIGTDVTDETITIQRELNAIPFLAYYDIFKNYYSNKQEDKAYVITGDPQQSAATFDELSYHQSGPSNLNRDVTIPMHSYQGNRFGYAIGGNTGAVIGSQGYSACLGNSNATPTFLLINTNTYYKFHFKGQFKPTNMYVAITYATSATAFANELVQLTNTNRIEYTIDGDILTIKFKTLSGGANAASYMLGLNYAPMGISSNLKLETFELANIDQMRMDILRNTDLDTTFMINQSDAGIQYPYKALFQTTTTGITYNFFKSNGLVLKTYQSDIYQNWLSTEFIDGATGVNAISAVNTESGSFTIDALNLAHKVYNMLNRIAISGGTYEDWQEAVYGEDAIRRAESPIYEGGMSAEIVFEEVVSTSDTETNNAGDQPLGSLAGKGTIQNVRGGNITIKIKEPSYIIGIMSITPRIDYCNGNEFDMTEINSLDDLHKPAMDQIGFQDLLAERLAWWGKVYDADDEHWINQKIGKQPAWIDYMTSVNQVYGEFAEPNGLNYMVLTRNYEYGDHGYPTNNITDATTYINPTKYNYTFANSSLDAQNFWVQIGINAIARRKMSAKVMPNL